MTQREPADFAAGQLSHLGEYYDIESDGVPLRILVIGMETGRTDEAVTLKMRRQQIMARAAEAPRARNQHMVGVTHALRVLHGRGIGDDPAGELLDFGNDHRAVHMFDAYAMANIRLCTSVRKGTKNSYPTATMTRNCVRHLQETIRILEPTVCVLQSLDIPKALAPIVTHRAVVAQNLTEVDIGGVRTLMAEFSHPTAWGALNWGRWTNMPYLEETVIPALRKARTRSGLSAAAASSYVRAVEDSVRARHHSRATSSQRGPELNQPKKYEPASNGPRNRQEQLYWDFWQRFRERVAAEHPEWKARAGTTRISPNATLPGTIPRTIFCSAFKPGPLRLELAFVHPDPSVNLGRFNALRAKRGPFEAALGEAVAWDEMPGKNDTRLYVVSPFNTVDDRENWPAMLDWLIEKHIRFRQAIDAIGGLEAPTVAH